VCDERYGHDVFDEEGVMYTGFSLLPVNPLTPTVAIAIKLPVPDRVKPSFAIFDIRALNFHLFQRLDRAIILVSIIDTSIFFVLVVD